MKLEAISKDTLAIIDRGGYDVGNRYVELAPAIKRAVSGTRSYSPDEVAELTARLASTPCDRAGRITVTNETTTGAAARLAAAAPDTVACLNFASAKNPGGGFIGAAKAQEEQVCRASALYPTLLTQPAYYRENRAFRDARYTDWAITSPEVPVFRDDRMKLIEQPFLASFVTMPAPNAGALDGAAKSDELAEIFRRRIASVFALSLELGSRRIVVGAWGCGAFRNSPELVAGAFIDELDRGWGRRFDTIVFAIYGRHPLDKNLEVFTRLLGPRAAG
jgi:uncharacterized protein (TIGR02452 family)